MSSGGKKKVESRRMGTPDDAITRGYFTDVTLIIAEAGIISEGLPPDPKAFGERCSEIAAEVLESAGRKHFAMGMEYKAKMERMKQQAAGNAILDPSGRPAQDGLIVPGKEN